MRYSLFTLHHPQETLAHEEIGIFSLDGNTYCGNSLDFFCRLFTQVFDIMDISEQHIKL